MIILIDIKDGYFIDLQGEFAQFLLLQIEVETCSFSGSRHQTVCDNIRHTVTVEMFKHLDNWQK